MYQRSPIVEVRRNRPARATLSVPLDEVHPPSGRKMNDMSNYLSTKQLVPQYQFLYSEHSLLPVLYLKTCGISPFSAICVSTQGKNRSDQWTANNMTSQNSGDVI
eukprot:scaffold121682_cov68-Cyclotella_meneghiniana.AAC.3